jgi:hypothetical protein
MKKFILALLAAGSITAVNAQKGTVLVYGTVGVNSNKMDWGSKFGNTKMFGWNINPGIGYQFTKSLTVGLQGGYATEKSETTAPFTPTVNVKMLDYRVSDVGVGAFLRHTWSLNNTFMLWHQLDLSYLMGSMENSDTLFGLSTSGAPIFRHSEDTYNGFSAMFTPAIGIAVGHGIGLNFAAGGIGYRNLVWNVAGPVDVMESSFMFTWGQQLNIGVSKNIGCRPKHKHMEPGSEHRKMKKEKADDDDDE